MLGKWKRTVDNGKVLGILLTDVDLESCWHPYYGTSKLTGNNQIDSMKAFIKTSCLYTINFTILLKHIFFQLSHVSKQYIHQSLRFYQFVHLIVSTSYSTKFLLFQFFTQTLWYLNPERLLDIGLVSFSFESSQLLGNHSIAR